MNATELDQSLSGADLDALDAYLVRFDSERAMGLETCDGFFAASHCAPQMLPPSFFLSEL